MDLGSAAAQSFPKQWDTRLRLKHANVCIFPQHIKSKTSCTFLILSLRRGSFKRGNIATYFATTSNFEMKDRRAASCGLINLTNFNGFKAFVGFGAYLFFQLIIFLNLSNDKAKFVIRDKTIDHST